MADESGTIEQVVQEMVFALEPLGDRLQAGQFETFFAELGLQLPPEVKNQNALLKALGDIVGSISELPPEVTALVEAVEKEDVGDILSAVAKLVATLAKFGIAVDAT